MPQNERYIYEKQEIENLFVTFGSRESKRKKGIPESFIRALHFMIKVMSHVKVRSKVKNRRFLISGSNSPGVLVNVYEEYCVSTKVYLKRSRSQKVTIK